MDELDTLLECGDRQAKKYAAAVELLVLQIFEERCRQFFDSEIKLERLRKAQMATEMVLCGRLPVTKQQLVVKLEEACGKP